MRTSLLVALVALVSMVSGCASVCDRLASPADKKGTCTNVTTNAVTKSTCDANVSKCTADDLKAVNAFLDCYDALPVCASGKELEFAASMLTCASKTSSVSAACNAALF